MKIELLTKEHYLNFEGELPPMTMKGIAVIDDGKVMGICAISTAKGENFVICAVDKRIDKRAVIQGWEMITAMMHQEKTYYALIDEDLPTAPGFLKHFGFEHLKDDIFIYRGE